MKSLKKLLVSALASSVFFSPHVSGAIGAKSRRSKSATSGTTRGIKKSNVVGMNGGVRPTVPTAPGMSRGSKIALEVGIPGLLLAGGMAVRLACKKANSSEVPKGGTHQFTVNNKPIPFEVAYVSNFRRRSVYEPENVHVDQRRVLDMIEKHRRKNEWENGVNAAKAKIVEIIGSEKYDVLRKACEKFSKGLEGLYRNETFCLEYEETLEGVISIELVDGDEYCNLEGQKATDFLDTRGARVNEFSRLEVWGKIESCLSIVAKGFNGSICRLGNMSKMTDCFDNEWGEGVKIETSTEDELYYGASVSSDLKKIRLCFHCNTRSHKQYCAITLKV